MDNTGYKQATVSYKVSSPGSEPLDVDGNLTRISGKKQAIALLEGHINPNPLRYDVEFYYAKGSILNGNPTITRDIQSCPIGYIRISPPRLIMERPNNTATFSLESSGRWELISGPTDTIDIDYVSGNAGGTTIKATGIIDGDGLFTFRNMENRKTATIYIAFVSGRPWVLETGSWNNLGFWFDNGDWKYE